MLRELKTFVAVAADTTFTGAGRRLGLTQSAVSAQIQRLESYLGVTLFDRVGRSALLNDAGRRVLSQAEEAIALIEGMAAGSGAARSGYLRVGAIASVQQGLLARVLPAFRQAFPDVSLRLLPGVSLNLVGQVDAGELDLALIIRPPFALPRELRWHALLREPIVLAVPAAFGESNWRVALETQPFIRYDRSSFGGRLVDGFLRRHRVSVRDAVELDEIDAMATLVRAGLGVALLPRIAGLNVEGMHLISLGAPDLYREIGAVVRQDVRDQAGGLVAELLSYLEKDGAVGVP